MNYEKVLKEINENENKGIIIPFYYYEREEDGNIIIDEESMKEDLNLKIEKMKEMIK